MEKDYTAKTVCINGGLCDIRMDECKLIKYIVSVKCLYVRGEKRISCMSLVIGKLQKKTWCLQAIYLLFTFFTISSGMILLLSIQTLLYQIFTPCYLLLYLEITSHISYFLLRSLVQATVS